MAGKNREHLKCEEKQFVECCKIIDLNKSNVQGNDQSNQHVGHQPSGHFVILM